MPTFTINESNEIVAFATPDEAAAHSATPFDSFSTADELAQLATGWPAERLLAVWNSVPGLTPAAEIKDAAKAARVIFKRLEKNGFKPAREKKPKSEGKAKAGAQSAKGAPAKGRATGKATTTKSAPAAKPAPKGKKAAKAHEAAGPREGSKTALIIGLLERKGGATLTEIMKAAKWQAHSVRGFVSGTLGKKMGLTVTSTKGDDGVRVYALKG